MTGRLEDLLEQARRRAFVGRVTQLDEFDDLLAGRSTRRVLLVHGPGGIGKSTLLLEFRARARAAGRPVALLDGAEIDPSPAAVTAMIGTAFGSDATADLPGGAVVLIDGYDQLGPVDAWLRREYLPSLPGDAAVVLAGREEPAAAWRTEPGWRDLACIQHLDALDPAETDELLATAGVPPGDRATLVRLGRGHPLATALLADAARTGPVPQRLGDVPELVSVLLTGLLREAPSPAHTDGLVVCTKAWLTTEDLLGSLIGVQAPAVWAWLAERPFVSHRPHGLVAHDLARDVLDAEFERRSPERYRTLHRGVHDHVVGRLRAATGPDRQLLAQQLLYLHRHSPMSSVFFESRAEGSAAVVPGRPDEHDEARAIIARHEGPASADLLTAWLADRPEGLNVVRDQRGGAAVAYHVVHPTGSSLEERDPVVRAALEYVAREGPPRPGEQVCIGRWLAGRDGYQRDRPMALIAAVTAILNWTTRPLAWAIEVVADREHWGPFFDYLAFAALFEIVHDGRRLTAYGLDLRRLPADAWLELMGEREHSGGTGPPPADLLRPPPLDRDRFAAAVRAALRDLHRPPLLATNPLLGTALATAAPAPAGSAVEGLRATLEYAAARLADEPRGEVLSAVVRRTYLRPARSQEAAAEVLGLPFSTYRRHLTRALERITDLCWAIEIGEHRPTLSMTTATMDKATNGQ